MTDTATVLLILFCLYCFSRGKLAFKPAPKCDEPERKERDE